MKTITLTRGQVALVDDCDFDWLNRWRWVADGRPGYGYYARRKERDKWIHMHRVITNAPKGMEVDHKNLNKLDNRRCNLRVCTKSQNRANIATYAGTKSGIKGVDFLRGKWRARVQTRHIGLFDSLEEAKQAHRQESLRVWGEYARV